MHHGSEVGEEVVVEDPSPVRDELEGEGERQGSHQSAVPSVEAGMVGHAAETQCSSALDHLVVFPPAFRVYPPS